MRWVLGKTPSSDEGEDDPLYRAALAVEQDERLAAEMAEWDATSGDGLNALRASIIQQS